jgi:UDP:flavonoid glycosyltransferase YjiC (YdhE family)
VRAVLKDEKYRCAARATQAAIVQLDGLERAANIIEDALKTSLR